MSSCKCKVRTDGRGVSQLFLLLRTNCVVFFSFCVVFSSVFGVCGGYQEQKFAMEPQDQTAVVGSRVTLPCRVEKKMGQLQWTKDDFGLGLHRDLSGYDRYKMIGSDEEGDYSLDIRDVTLDDDAKYQCQVSSGPRGEPAIRSRYARLTVLIPPEPPRILQGNFFSTREDTSVSLECVSIGGKPPAEITWVDSNAGVLTQGVIYTVEPMSDGQRFTARSVLKMDPKKEHHNQTYTCQAQNTADRAYRAASIQIEVKYSPKVKLQVVSGTKGKTPEGQDVVLECKYDANPMNVTYKWFMNGELLPTETNKEMKIQNITRKYNGVNIKCHVINEVGKSDDTKPLEITYPPSFTHQPKDVEAEIGSIVTLICDVDGYPIPDIKWLHQEEDQNILVGKTPNFTLTLDTHTSGKYICKATVEGFSEIQTEASVFIKGPPKILSNSTQFGSQGDSIHVECAAFAIPRIESIVWMFDGKEIDSIHDQDYAFLEDLQPGGIVNSTLIIRDSQSKHFGSYKCNVSNEYGSDALEIVLRQSKTFPLLIILFGVTSGTIMVAAVIMLVILCQRKQRKNKQQVTEKPDVTVTAEELFKENDRNSNISDLKLELRQANGTCEIDYSNTGSDSTLCSNAKLGSGIQLAGTVPLSSINQNTYQPYRYSNDYTDPVYAECYKVNGFSNGYQTYVHYGQDYTPGSLRVQSPTVSNDNLTPNRSVNGSLPRSVDTASTVQFNPGNGSQNNSLQRSNKRQDSAINNLGLPSNEVNRIPNGGLIHGVDVRYAATYGNPHLRTGAGLGFTVNTAKPASTPAPPPYSSVRNSVILPSGPSSHSITSPTSLTSPQYAASPITNSTLSTDSTQPAIATSSTTPQSPSAHYILAPSNRTISNATVTKKGNVLQTPLATHV